MYKLFLCLRYLIRRRIALVAIVGMALCVLMVVIVGCVMNGFLDLVETGARGMMGDIIVYSAEGVKDFEEFIDQVNGMPEVVRATPVIYTVGLLRLGDSYTEMVRVAGIRLPEAAQVTSFADEMYPSEMAASPSFTLPDSLSGPLLDRNKKLQTRLDEYAAMRDEADQAIMDLQDDNENGTKDAKIAEIRAYLEQVNSVISAIRRRQLYQPKLPGIILGIDIPFTTERDETTGEYTRILDVGGAEKAMLTLLPMGRGNIDSMTQPVKRTFNIVADQRFGIYMVDSSHVYVDFDELARLIEAENSCEQVQIKLTAQASDNRTIAQTRDHIQILWEEFAADKGISTRKNDVRTWRQQQATYIDAIEKQRDLMVIILGVISLVAVVLVFAIFYMMIVQKTRDIGIIKSIGATDGGIAQIFLMYGAAVGLIGSIIGAIGGILFVLNINAIHDCIANVFKWRLFNRQAYIFDRIPDNVDYNLVLAVVIGAIIAGLLGAALPSIRAARMQPVESLRYE